MRHEASGNISLGSWILPAIYWYPSSFLTLPLCKYIVYLRQIKTLAPLCFCILIIRLSIAQLLLICHERGLLTQFHNLMQYL